MPAEQTDASAQSGTPLGTTELSFKKDQTIFEEKQESEGAYLILQGEVDIFRTVDGVFNHLATLPDGNILGESSVIRRDNHSVTARARTEVRALFIEAPALRQAISDPLVNTIFRTMAARLADRYIPERQLLEESQNVEAQRAARRNKPKRHSGIPVMEGVSDIVLEKMTGKITIGQFPFFVGNTRSYGELAQLSDQSLMLPLPSATDLEAKHFEIVKRGRDIVIRDLGSKHGTVVNGKVVRKFTKDVEETLVPGDNIISTGGMKSQITFVIYLQEIQ